ncbi:hypothetical protein CsSME_00027735 [Camellia sinensis var. sinensis]
MSFGILNPWFELWEQIWKTQNLASSLERGISCLSDHLFLKIFACAEVRSSNKTCARVKNCVSRSSEHRAEIFSNYLRSSDQAHSVCPLERRKTCLSETPVARHRTRARGADLDSCFVKPTNAPHIEAFGNHGLLAGYDAKPTGADQATNMYVEQGVNDKYKSSVEAINKKDKENTVRINNTCNHNNNAELNITGS